jgi:hypothetical protein
MYIEMNTQLGVDIETDEYVKSRDDGLLYHFMGCIIFYQ